MARSTKNYDVGYGKTPVHTRFKAGLSGNPAGRPKGSKNLQTLLAQELERPVEVTVNGQRRKMSKAQVMVVKHVDRAIAGNDRAFAMLVKIDGAGLGGGEPPASGAAGPASEIPQDDYSSLLQALVARRMQEGDDATNTD